MSTTEEVQTPTTTEAPTGKAAFVAARAEIRARAQSQDPELEPETPPDDTPAPSPSQEPEKPADETPAPGESEDTLLPPEEVAKLNAKERKQYESMNKAFTTKTQKLAAERKELEKLASYRQLIETLESDPDAALEILAQQRGLKLSKIDTIQPVVEQKTTEALAQLPEEWQFMKPLFESVGKQVRDAVLAEVRGELQPIQQAQSESISRAVAAETQSTIEQFSAKYPGWQQHEAKMLDIGKKIIPADGAMSDFEYMELLFNAATQGMREADKTKKVIEKINKAVESSEPINAGVDGRRVDHVMPANITSDRKKWFREAAKAAARGERWTVTE